MEEEKTDKRKDTKPQNIEKLGSESIEENAMEMEEEQVIDSENDESKMSEEDAAFSNAVKNFRNSHDVENFYRFVHENELRREARIIFDSLLDYMNKKKKVSSKKASK